MAPVGLPTLATILAITSFQLGAALAKPLILDLGAVGAATVRLLLGAVVLVVAVRPWREWQPGTPLGTIFALGLAVAAVIQLFYLALERLPLGVAMAVQFLGPLAIAVFGARRTVDLLWPLLAGAGLWSLLAMPQGPPLDPIGLLFALGAACAWAAYILIGRSASSIHGRSTASLAIGAAALAILPAGIADAGLKLFDPAKLPLALAVAFFSVALPCSLEFYALPRLPARTFAILMSLEPALAALLGFLILGEHLTTGQVIGLGLIALAAVGTAWSRD